MSYLDRIAAANQYDLTRFVPFEIAEHHVGWVRRERIETLTQWPTLFRCERGSVQLVPSVLELDVNERTRLVGDALVQLRDCGILSGWRDELYAIAERFDQRPLLLLERAAVPMFGVVAYGVHINGYVRARDGTFHMWIARRALDKPTAPGKLDQIVAGGQPFDLPVRANVIKECAEEAGMDPALAARARSVGTISYVLETPLGLRPDVLFCFDLELPRDFRPVNTDGEVAAFELLPIEAVANIVRNSDDFKFNCSLVIIDFLVRHGLIEADSPDYASIVRGLHAAPTTPLPRRPRPDARSRDGV